MHASKRVYGRHSLLCSAGYGQCRHTQLRHFEHTLHSALPIAAALQFQRKLTEVVQSHNNFMTALYQGGAHLMDFPYPEDVRFYRELGQLAEEVITKTKHPFSSGTMLGEQLRRLMAKISHKDW